MKKFGDIEEIFKIISVNENLIEVIINKSKKYCYLYEIEPIIILDDEDKSLILLLQKYEEFLRSLNLDLQIIFKNEEINEAELLGNMHYDNELKRKLNNEYIKNMKCLLKEIKIFNMKFQLIISNNYPVENVEKYIAILNDCGLIVNRIKDKKEMIKILKKGFE